MSSANEQEDKLFISRIDDAVDAAEKRGRSVYLGFLNERQSYIAEKYLKSRGYAYFKFFGGHKSAARVYLCVYPEYLDAPEASEFPITALEFKFRQCDKLSHKDFLGAIMALGVTRESIGDIVVLGGRALVFADGRISQYLLSQITKIGSVGVKVSVCDETDMDFPPKFEGTVLTVSSMRLDNIVAALSKLSREKTAQLIASGLVSVNYSPNFNVSSILSEGDILSIRKKGKFVITNSLGSTKKGRVRLSVKIFK